jgi:hypothetical protein
MNQEQAQKPNFVCYFDMTKGLSPIRNVWGLGDPDVHKIDGRWTMFLGGFTNRFKNNLFMATLPEGAPLSSNDWTLVAVPGRQHQAQSLIPQPAKGNWDAYGLHTPSYVKGVDPVHGEQERIYYTGRGSKNVTGTGSQFSIGYLLKTKDGWLRHGEPVHTGTPERPSVLEPTVCFFEGKWRMWYVSVIHEVGRNEMPNYQFEYIESDNGTDGWSKPEILFTIEDGYFDNAVIKTEEKYEMIVARGSNLYSMPNFPNQGLWRLEAERPTGNRKDWSEAVQILNADGNPEPWFANGPFGPSVQYGDTEDDKDVLYVFFAGVYGGQTNWLKMTLKNLLRLRKPPVPAPYYFAIGRMTYRRQPKATDSMPPSLHTF